MDQSFIKAIEQQLSSFLRKPVFIEQYQPVSGGSINDAYRLETKAGSFFIKINDSAKYPEMFEAEEKGLQLLRENSAMKIPAVISKGDVKTNSFLLLEFINNTSAGDTSFYHFGSQLAAMHKVTNVSFGLNHDNYIGSLKQKNSFHHTWIEFFIEERLSAQLKLAYDLKRVDRAMIAAFDKFYQVLPELFPVEQPSLLHGDLWSGNFMISENGEPCIFDPAVYYGHREMDIAMTKLFGGFQEVFYDSYNEHFPLENGWKKRVDICNLYPLLVHVNLFGGAYVNQVKNIVRYYTD